MLPSRNTKRYPLLWFDEDKGVNRPLRYAINQKTPFEDEQDGNAIVEPIIFEDYGPVHFKMSLMNVQKRHMVPAGKVDRILLRYSFMYSNFESTRDKLVNIIKDQTNIKYNDLNSILLKNF